MICNVLGWLLTGLVVGLVARFVVPGPQKMGWFATIGLGLLGSAVGAVISWMIWPPPDDPNPVTHWPGYLLSILGAVIVLLVFRAVSRRPPPP